MCADEAIPLIRRNGDHPDDRNVRIDLRKNFVGALGTDVGPGDISCRSRLMTTQEVGRADFLSRTAVRVER
ncbi:hypothetical protein ACWCXH_19690 [Kitasatospora sp. NPDC001660]